MDPNLLKAIRTNVEKADLVLIGQVIAIGPAPPAWSGTFAAYQTVTYRPISLLKKRPPNVKDSITVHHLVVAKSRTADKDVPRLREDLFAKDAHLVVFVREKNDRFECFDENYGVLSINHEITGAITRILEK